MKPFWILAFYLFAFNFSHGQKVGVVLSGGGAAGAAHIGVLKALEENNIPIDYIAGTSVGALIGGFYAAGYSPSQIEGIVTSPQFRDAASGIIDEDYRFYFQKSDENASMLKLNFNIDSLIETNIPTNFISSNPIDYGLMTYFATANAVAKRDFDSLMIPFRCLAANITQRKQTILKDGDLATAIRGSMTYPFYIQPITIDGDIMFDGGLYNNFPSDILCMEFNPDFIIASNVASAIEKPTEENLLSQLKTILIKESNFEINCNDGVVINSNVDGISTFDFYEIEKAIQSGYTAASSKIDQIKEKVQRNFNQDSLIRRRANFNIKKPLLMFNSVEFQGFHPNQAKYFEQSLNPKGTSFSEKQLSKRFYELASNEKVKSIYPTSQLDSSTGMFNLNMKINREKRFRAAFGGVIASKPFSTGFFELDYQFLKATALKASGNIYFGNFYSSAEGKVRWDVPFDIPFFLESQFTVNRYDFFNSRSTFIEENDPPYIITSERYWESKIGLPVLTKGKLLLGGTYLWQDLEYYQDDDFLRGDTADYTQFEGFSTFMKYERNTLNRKMYPTKGHRFDLKFRYVNGQERTQPGSNSISTNFFKQEIDWFLLNLKYEDYFFKKGRFRLGTYIEANYSDQPFFQNYTATLLNAPTFNPIPESKTLFLEQYRAKSFAAIGVKTIYTIRETIDFRLEGYLFQPYEEYVKLANGQARLGEEVQNQNFIGTISTVYHSSLGPLAVSLNYYNDAETELSFLVHFGYILFNKKGME